MRAAIRTRYGPPEVVSLAEVARPSAGPGEILIRVHATTVNRTDCALRAAKPFLWRLLTGVFRPRLRILGNEYAGDVESVASDVTRFRPGMKVFGYNDGSFGAHAEYLVVSQNSPIAELPTNLDYEQAVPGTEGSHYALAMIRGAHIEAGQDVLVYGATGAIGSAAVQLLHGLGARVTAVGDTQTLDLVRDLGADTVLDRTTGEFDRHTGSYHAVFDTAGKSSFGRCRRLLRPDGVYISSDLGRGAQNIALALIAPARRGRRRVLFPIPRADPGMAEHFRNLMQAGTFKPLIDRRYSLDEIVQAHRYVDSGQKLGNVVIVVAGGHDQHAAH